MKKFDICFALFGISYRNEISLRQIVIISVCTLISIMLNFAGSILAEKVIFPLYFDSIMTLFVTASFGLIPGLICAVGSNLMLTIFVDSSIFFVICHLLTVIFAWLIFMNYSCKENFDGSYPIHLFLWAALFSAISNGIIGNIIVDIVFSSVTGRPHADFVVQGIFSAVPNRIFATYFAGIVENLTDKMISACISFGFYKFINNKFSDVFL